jgi:hypothetical protein
MDQPKNRIKLALLSMLFVLTCLPIAAATVASVGCRSDGQLGPQGAPKVTSISVDLSNDSAAQLAYYVSPEHVAVRAPKGWYCFGTYGSNGDFLFVSPQPIDTRKLMLSHGGFFSGPAVEMKHEYGGTSGRFGVAAVIARVFPSHNDFVQNVIQQDVDAGINPPASFQFGPYPSDRVTYKSSNLVEFETPANADGLGTDSLLQKNSDPVLGAAMLVGEETDLKMVLVRLPSSEVGLAPTIIQQVERDADRPVR